ncbi:MAG: exodeoxyribonuclease III [Myxococcales bacterium]|nr:exodeoxyribonuclease III [Myxococcales bacterium]MCB9546042.1 exodeoxyribonuclease III [Myxococcales bacterium]
MRIASWNVNSIVARTDRFLNWLESREPDVVCLQELKNEGDRFPWDEIGELGYYAEILGQKTYNGVAIVARSPIQDVWRTLDDDDPQARLIAGVVDGVRVISAYVPNGGEPDSDKWVYKLQWYAKLRDWLDRRLDPGMPVALCGDFNVAPEDRDVRNIERWADSVLCRPEARAALQRVTDWGLVDTFRLKEQGDGHHTWWDYRNLGFQKDDGLRIDQIWATASLAGTVADVAIDLDERRGEKPSDHAPIWTDFDL